MLDILVTLKLILEQKKSLKEKLFGIQISDPYIV